MEKDIEEIRGKIESFIERYGVTLEVETADVLMGINGIRSGKAKITIHS